MAWYGMVWYGMVCDHLHHLRWCEHLVIILGWPHEVDQLVLFLRSHSETLEEVDRTLLDVGLAGAAHQLALDLYLTHSARINE